MTIPEHIMARARDLTHMIYCEVDEDGRPYIPADETMTIACSILAAVQEERELLRDLADCLEDMTGHYVEVRNDLYGFEASEEIEVIAARKLVAHAQAIRNRSVTEGE